MVKGWYSDSSSIKKDQLPVMTQIYTVHQFKPHFNFLWSDTIMWRHHVRASCDDIMWRHHVTTSCDDIMWGHHVTTSCDDIMWRHHVTTSCDDIMWRHHVTTSCDDIMWRHHVTTSCDDIMWRHHVTTSCDDIMWRHHVTTSCDDIMWRHHVMQLRKDIGLWELDTGSYLAWIWRESAESLQWKYLEREATSRVIWHYDYIKRIKPNNIEKWTFKLYIYLFVHFNCIMDF